MWEPDESAGEIDEGRIARELLEEWDYEAQCRRCPECGSELPCGQHGICSECCERVLERARARGEWEREWERREYGMSRAAAAGVAWGVVILLVLAGVALVTGRVWLAGIVGWLGVAGLAVLFLKGATR